MHFNDWALDMGLPNYELAALLLTSPSMITRLRRGTTLTRNPKLVDRIEAASKGAVTLRDLFDAYQGSRPCS